MQPRTTPRLWIFADSFGVCDPKRDSERVWTRQLAKKLSQHIGQPIELFNYSLIGCSQDWTVSSYMSFVEQMQSQDYVVIVLTSASRYWYFEDQPTLTNWNIIDLDQQVGRDRARAAETYLKYIQRPSLDYLQTVSRLGLIAYQTHIRNLRKPLMVRAFDDHVDLALKWPDLNWTQGCLAEIQWVEYQDANELLADYERSGQGYFKGYDCRYNHMCLSNHDILSDRLAAQLIDGTVADLSQGYVGELIGAKWHNDSELIANELNPRAVEYYFEHIHNSGPILPWKRRTGIEKIMDQFSRKDS